MHSFFQKGKQRYIENGIKPIVFIAIVSAVLILIDMNIKEVLIYLVVYHIGKNMIITLNLKR